MTTENLKLVAKIKINGFIVAQTGLHIGGSKTALDIGGIDLNVIKTVEGVPFVPGSSLKGKLRTMLAREAGSMKVRGYTRNLRRRRTQCPAGWAVNCAGCFFRQHTFQKNI